MTEKQAEREGLSYTGYSDNSWGSSYGLGWIVAKAADLRKQGFRAVVVTDYDGYKSIYADQAYFDHERYDSYKKRLSHIPASREKILADLKELEAEAAELEQRINDYEKNAAINKAKKTK